jgi:hypothetical protein
MAHADNPLALGRARAAGLKGTGRSEPQGACGLFRALSEPCGVLSSSLDSRCGLGPPVLHLFIQPPPAVAFFVRLPVSVKSGMDDPRAALEERIKELNKERLRKRGSNRTPILKEIGRLNAEIVRLDALLPPRTDRADKSKRGRRRRFQSPHVAPAAAAGPINTHQCLRPRCTRTTSSPTKPMPPNTIVDGSGMPGLLPFSPTTCRPVEPVVVFTTRKSR